MVSSFSNDFSDAATIAIAMNQYSLTLAVVAEVVQGAVGEARYDPPTTLGKYLPRPLNARLWLQTPKDGFNC